MLAADLQRRILLVLHKLLGLVVIGLAHVELLLLARSDDDVRAVVRVEAARLPAGILYLGHEGLLFLK